MELHIVYEKLNGKRFGWKEIYLYVLIVESLSNYFEHCLNIFRDQHSLSWSS